MRTVIEAQGHHEVVAEATTGVDALLAARETSPDIAIFDYALPGMNGRDLTLAIKREVPRTEILIYTMLDHEELIMAMLRAGARGFVRWCRG